MRKNLLRRVFSAVVAATMAVTTLGALGFTASATGRMPDTLWMFAYGSTANTNLVFSGDEAAQIGGSNASAQTRVQNAIGELRVSYTFHPNTSASGTQTASNVRLLDILATPNNVQGTNGIGAGLPLLNATIGPTQLGAVPARNRYGHTFVPNEAGRNGFYTFNTQANMNTAMTAILREEQRILNIQLTWMRNEVQKVIDTETAARTIAGANTATGRQHTNNINALSAARDRLIRANNSQPAFTYVNSDLFVGDSWPGGVHSVVQLDFTQQGSTQFISQVANSSQLTQMGGSGYFGSVRHLNVENFTNSSWWRANSAGTDANGHMNWFAGQMVPGATLQNQNWRNHWLIYDGYGSTGGGGGGGGGTTGCNPMSVAEVNRTYSNIAYRCNDHGHHFPNLAAWSRNGCGGSVSTYTPFRSSTSHRWFSVTGGDYSSAAISGHQGYFVDQPSSSVGYVPPPSNLHLAAPNGVVYESTETGFFYPNLSALRAALGNNAPYRTVTRAANDRYSTTNRYFNYETGRYQPNASSNTIWITGTTTANVQQPNPLPFPQQPLTPTNPTTVNRIDAYTRINNRNFVGWNNILAAINANPGIQVNIEMQEQTSIPASVLAAARTHRSTLVIRMANGAIWNIRGENIQSARTTNLGITYGTRNVPAAAMNAVSQGALARAQLTIGDNNPLGYSASVRVRYAENRAGRTVTLYRFNNATGRLDQVSRVQIQPDGRATFTGISHGGDFVTIIT